MMGCAEKRDHSTLHNQEYPDHCVQLNVSTWRAWCYECNNELLLADNVPSVRGVLGLKRSEALSTNSYQ